MMFHNTDVALHILSKHRYLALLRDAKKETALHALARKPLKTAYVQLNIWKRLSLQCNFQDTYLVNIAISYQRTHEHIK